MAIIFVGASRIRTLLVRIGRFARFWIPVHGFLESIRGYFDCADTAFGPFGCCGVASAIARSDRTDLPHGIGCCREFRWADSHCWRSFGQSRRFQAFRDAIPGQSADRFQHARLFPVNHGILRFLDARSVFLAAGVGRLAGRQIRLAEPGHAARSIAGLIAPRDPHS